MTIPGNAKVRHEVIPARAYHIGRLVHRLRPAHRAAMIATGVDPHRVLRDAFLQSSFCRAGLIDGELAAIWGVTGGALSSTGVVWVAFTEAATKHPILIMRETRKQLAEMAATRTVLESGVIVADEAAWRFAQRLGFFLKRPGGGDTLSPQTAPLECILSAAPEYRVALPTGASGVLVGYQGALYG